eukprot:CAMPEP_0118885708 /NCGR_PEP_ID=MMETSP1163-20130328/24074_1 /TAXON_ID=124430 /ORGANISM="Phaeomonas parva, Strain CCMP2877" /LENGTH=172 /DNA_ID=CAMNT_0006823771 /DNA_START=97 /DNA_END=616 /DNA_ORIENTATION=+
MDLGTHAYLEQAELDLHGVVQLELGRLWPVLLLAEHVLEADLNVVVEHGVEADARLRQARQARVRRERLHLRLKPHGRAGAVDGAHHVHLASELAGSANLLELLHRVFPLRVLRDAAQAVAMASCGAWATGRPIISFGSMVLSGSGDSACPEARALGVRVRQGNGGVGMQTL